MIDTNGDGKICISELRTVVEQFGKELSDQDLRDMVKNVFILQLDIRLAHYCFLI